MRTGHFAYERSVVVHKLLVDPTYWAYASCFTIGGYISAIPSDDKTVTCDGVLLHCKQCSFVFTLLLYVIQSKRS